MNWQSLQLNLPTVPVHDLIVKNDDLAVATHGRAFWVLDDIAPLRQTNGHLATEDVFIYNPRTAIRLKEDKEDGGSIAANRVGSNPPSGAMIDYFLKAAPTDQITVEILDTKGTVIRTFKSSSPPLSCADKHPPTAEDVVSLPACAGMNRFVWDLRLDPPAGVPGAVYMEGSKLQGTIVLPGTYTVRLTAQGKVQTAPLQVKMDPTVTTSEADLQKQFDLAVKIRDRISQAHETVSHIRNIHGQLQSLEERISGAPESDATVVAAKSLDQKMTAVEDALFQVHKTAEKDSFNYGGRLNDMFIALHEYVEQADTAPTEQTYDVFTYLDHELQQQLTLWNAISKNDIPAFNELAHGKNVPILGLPIVAVSAH
jgi:hypothetical protein